MFRRAKQQNKADATAIPTRVLLASLLKLAKPEWVSLSIGTFFLLIGAAASLSYPQAIRVIVDQAMGANDSAVVDKAALILLVIFAVQGVAIAFRSYLFTVAGERIVMRLREKLYGSIIEQDIAFFDKTRTGELANRLAADTSVLQNTVSVNISMALRHLVSATGAVGLLLYTSPVLTILMLVVVPAVAVGAVWVGRKIRRYSKRAQDALAQAGEVAEETISGVRTVRSFSKEEHEKRRYGEAVFLSFAHARKRALVSAFFIGSASFAAYGAIAVVVWYGGRMVVDGAISVGDLTSFVLYTLIVALSLASLGTLWADFMRAAGAGERVFSLMEKVPTMVMEEGEVLETLSGSISFQKVSFSYPSRPDIQVLKEIKLKLQAGEIVALVGASGAGKSTIASLCFRLYDPTVGQITLDEKNLCDLQPKWLRTKIGVVAQEPILFSTSIEENIRYGRKGASFDDVVQAAKIANAFDFVTSFPEEFKTQVGERGVQLSGGQKQRIAIARAVLKDPTILILDEATSALDTESEFLVKEALDRLMKGRTTLIIAHRLSTVRDADRVLVLDKGVVVQAGAHEELIAQGGIYKRLVERQLN